MKTSGTIYICDECGKQFVDANNNGNLPDEWLECPSYFHNSFTVYKGDMRIPMEMSGKLFCSMPCLTFHIGRTVTDAIAANIKAKAVEMGELELGGEGAAI